MADDHPEAAEAAEVFFVWGWGAGTDGQLGTGVPQDCHSPQPLHLAPAVGSPSCGPVLSSPTPIACGGAHAAALTGDGKVLTWGRGSHGQLGQGHLGNYFQPKLVKQLECFRVSYVSAGWNHSGFVTDTGCLFTCGDGSYGQLGHGDNLSRSSPAQVLFFESKHILQIACGMRHSLAAVKEKEGISVYGFGAGRHGQLGIILSCANRSFNSPQVIRGFDGEAITSIHANGNHSAATSFKGNLYIWGKDFHGKLVNSSPHKVESHLKFSQVALGWNHALLLTDDGEVFMLGGNRHGRLTDCYHVEGVKSTTLSSSSVEKDELAVPLLERVPGLNGTKVIHIAAGAEHSAVVTEKAEIMTWGWGEHGQLGLGNILDQTQPQMVRISDVIDAPSQFRVFCGSGFTFATRTVSL